MRHDAYYYSLLLLIALLRYPNGAEAATCSDFTCPNGYGPKTNPITTCSLAVCSTSECCDAYNCAGGPATGGVGVDYAACRSVFGCTTGTACNQLATGGVCDPGCLNGFRKTGGVSFQITCSSLGAYSDVSATQCTVNTCTLGPRTPTPGVDYSVCNTLTTSLPCTPVCSEGYSTVTNATPFILNCNNIANDAPGSYYDDNSGLICSKLPCNGQVRNPQANVLYNSCVGLSTGDTCSPQCTTGYAKTAGSAFSIVCSSDGSFTDSSGIQCAPSTCSNGPTTATPNADYSSCNVKTTGEMCTPMCRSGYSGTSASFALSCQNGQYVDNSGLSCVPTSCSGVQSVSPGVDYTQCNQLKTGSVCTPQCLAGYQKSSGSAFTLLCTPLYADSSNTVCVKLGCNQGPLNPQPGVDYSSCNLLTTGQSCQPSCLTGYTTATPPTAFTTQCTANGYVDSSGIVCTGNPCTGGVVNPAAGASYATCSQLQSGGTCTPSCQQTYVKTSGGSFTLQCVNNVYTDGSGIVCAKQLDECSTTGANVCSAAGQLCSDPSFITMGDWTCSCSPPSVGVPSTTSPAQCALNECTPNNVCAQNGQTCTDPTAALNDWYCSCVAPAQGVATAAQATCTYVGECAQHASTCTSRGQACYDQNTTSPNDWQCTCVPPLIGSPALLSPTTCYIDECTNNPTCSAAGQQCRDPDTSSTSRNDWQCLCAAPMSGTQTAAQAACTLDECENNFQVCASKGQTCLDKNKSPASKGDWECVCVSSVGSAVGGPATCTYSGECAPYSSICTSAGQACVDPSTGVGDWYCQCVSPQVGPPGDQGPASCVFDECGLPAAAVCKNNNQLCTDPNTSPSSIGDWRCVCNTPSVGTKQGAAATCTFDECTSHGSTCSTVGQTCTDPDTRVSAVNDWVCQCLPPATGAASVQQASCVFSGECVPYSNVCTSKGQTCVDPSAGVGDWQCQCVPPQTGAAVMGAPATCILDECTVYNTCQQANQVCEDPNTSPSSKGDWKCSCAAPSVGVSVGGAALCVLDECIVKGNAVCNGAGQVCKDPDTSPTSLNNWVCSCVHPAAGAATMGTATCVQSGECVPYSSVCTSNGQTCADPSSAVGDWQCACVAPSVGNPQVAGPAVCVLDECTVAPRCPDGQTCFDPKPTPSSTGDWECRCNSPSVGSLRGGAASCTLDECVTKGSMCLSAGQVCDDPNISLKSLNDWMCKCVSPANGTATAAPAACVFGGECAAYATQCTKQGQTCVDPSPAFGDWECRCVSPQQGLPTTKGPATCVYDECQMYASVCEGSGQQCFDPDTAPSLTGDWECRCPLPTTGSAVAGVASCVYDECRSANISGKCAAAGQVCYDPQKELNSLGDWTCGCVAPATGSSTAGPATCQYQGECIVNSSTCTAAGQTCYDPFPTPGDWQCRCVAPSVGDPATASPAQCEIDECKSSCPTCAYKTCSDMGQVCNDPNKAYSATGDWVCTCVAPATGSAVGRAASCSRDECVTNGHTCTAVGQVCVDPNESDKSLNDWMCKCVAPSTGQQQRAAATCVVQNECTTTQSVCTQAGQYCDDPSTSADNWMCKCPPPQQGSAVVKGTTSCTLDECTVTCPTCADTGAGNVCTAAGQTCYDPDTSPMSTRNWKCTCPSPLGNVSSEAKPATCTIDECATAGAVCASAGQICRDPNVSPTSRNDWACECAPPAVGVGHAQIAVCTFFGECVPYSATCTDAGQACSDPSNAVGDWTCRCVYPYTGTPRVAAPTVCELDECTATCATCADSGSGNVCTAAGQTCKEGSTASGSVSDWQCVCTAPLTGAQTADAATCELDECIGLATCSSVGQVCRDQNPSPDSKGDWVCECPSPASGSAVGTVATCQFAGECAPYSYICTQKGQTCFDPSNNTGDWQCLCVAPQVGGPGTAQPANCTKDECENVTACLAAGQDCVDPNPSPTSTGDWECKCRAPAAGSAVGKPAKCGADECATQGGVCTAKGQTCLDTNSLTFGDWRCTCPLPSQGAQIAGPAVCTLDECADKQTVCTSVGQMCRDINTTDSLNDWQCECAAPYVGQPGVTKPATCVINECSQKGAVCTAAGQDCVAQPDGFLCVCKSPYEGNASNATATCLLDECVGNTVCSVAGQVCLDKDKLTNGTWVCLCQKGYSGEGLGQPAAMCSKNCENLENPCFQVGQICTEDSGLQCECTGSGVGKSAGAAAACQYSGVCQAHGGLCAAAGQACYVADGSDMWGCVCVPPSTGAMRLGGPADCTIDECQHYNPSCAMGQSCIDPNTSIASLSDWSCTCSGNCTTAAPTPTPATTVPCSCGGNQTCVQTPPGSFTCRCNTNFKGQDTINAAATCFYDECTDNAAVCAKAGQACLDTSAEEDSWECRCNSPMTGSAVGGVAACTAVDLCKDKPCGSGQGCNTSGASFVCSCVEPEEGVDVVNGKASCAAPSEGKKLYEKWWFWLLLALLLICCCLMLFWIVKNSQREADHVPLEEGPAAEQAADPLLGEENLDSPQTAEDGKQETKRFGYMPPPPPTPPPSLPPPREMDSTSFTKPNNTPFNSVTENGGAATYKRGGPQHPLSENTDDGNLYPPPPSRQSKQTVLHELHTLLSTDKRTGRTNPLQNPAELPV